MFYASIALIELITRVALMADDQYVATVISC